MVKKAQHEILIKTYELYMTRYNAIFPRVPQDLRLFSTVNIGIIGGLVALLHENIFKCENPGRFVYPIILLIGGLAIIFIAWIGLKGTKSSYDAWTRTITTLAKLECQLGLHEPQKSLGRDQQRVLWKEEPIVFKGFKRLDLDCSDSEEFVKKKWEEEDYSKISQRVFCAWGGLGIILSHIGFAILIVRFCNN